MQSIEEFVAVNGGRQGSVAWHCRLSEEHRAIIVDALSKGYGAATVAKYAKQELGLADATPSKVKTFKESLDAEAH